MTLNDCSTQQTARVQLAAVPLQAAGTSADEYDVLAITAGEGNGWRFDAAVLQDSAALWEGIECFVDHASLQHSLRDLAGVCHRAEFDPARQGIRLSLRPLGPAAPLLREVASAMLGTAPRPDVGFSADLIFEAQERQVTRILRVLSLDLVLRPARGGQFLLPEAAQSLQLNQKGPLTMTEPVSAPAAAVSTAQLNEMLLETTLTAAHLPPVAADRLRSRFGGDKFSLPALQAAISDTRELLSDLTAAGSVQGLSPAGRVSAMFSSEDQFRAAAHDLMGVERPAELKSARVAKLSGIRELYTLTTGDRDFYGHVNAERAQFATTLSLPSLLKDTLNKLVLQGWNELGRSGYRWWEPVVSVQHFTNLHDITGVLVGEVTTLPQVQEGAAYTPLDVADNAETGSWGKFGGYIGLTLEMFEKDETHKLRLYPYKLASAAMRRISALVGSVFTAASGAGPDMADQNPVFDLGRGNLGSAALSSASWEAASAAVYNQSMLVKAGGTAPKLALDARYLVVPRALRLAAQRILYPSFEREANLFSENLQRGEMGDVITCPEMTDPNDWAAVADPRLAPGIIVGERFGLLPEIFVADNETSGALFTNDELRMKVRHWVSVFVADHRPLYKSNVA
mgnify:CR=1 FL=1